MKKTRVQKNKQVFDIVTSTLMVMELFFKYPNIEFTLSEVAEKTGLSKATASKIIKNLQKNEFVNIVNLEVVYRIRANTDNRTYQREKIARNIATMVRSDIVEFLAEEFNRPKCIVLFGSFRTGEDDVDSDIDIAVEVSDKRESGVFEFKEFKDIESILGRKITVHVFNRGSIDNNLFTNIANGFVMYGLLEVSK